VAGAVATLGTALTPEHARLLSRYSEQIVLVYDGDRAGRMAAEKGSMHLLAAGQLHIRVAVLPEGQAPCDFFRERGSGGAGELLERTTDLIRFLLDRAALRHDFDTLEGRKTAADELLRAIAGMEDAVARELILGQIGDSLRISA